MLSKLKISQKIYLMGSLQFCFILLVGWIGFSQMNKIGKELIDIAEKNLPLTKSITLLTEHHLQQSIYFERAVFEGHLVTDGYPDAEDKFLKYNGLFNAQTAVITNEIVEIENFIEEAIPHLYSPKTVEEYQHLLTLMIVIEDHYDSLTEQASSVLEEITSRNNAAALTQLAEVEDLQDKVTHEIVDILNEIEQFTIDAALEAERDEQEGIKYILIALCVSLVLSVVTPFIIGRAITQPMQKLNDRLREVADGDGDLTLRLSEEAKDETGDTARSFNNFMGKLSHSIRNVNQSADELGQSSENAIRVMETTLENVKQQQTETEMVASAIEQMGEAIQHVAINTSKAAQVAENAKQRVTEGEAAAVDTQRIIKQLATEVSGASSVIESLASETDNIGNVLDAIRGIADQTNLLALNAAIEAARAGDTGRGFAVVADEVRSLAQRTQTSTGDIQELVERLQQEAKNAVDSMKKGSDSTAVCLEKSTETASALEAASQAVNEISDLNAQIASTAEEQSAATDQINENVINISKIAEQTSSGTEVTAEANQDIAKNIVKLHTILNQFST